MLAILYAPVKVIGPVVGVLILAAIFEYRQLLVRKLPRFSVKRLLAFLAGVVVLVCGLGVLPHVASVHGNVMMLYLIAIVKFSDMGGFAIGLGSKRVMGNNHKLCPTISPNKSWEGLGGSIVGSILMSCAFMPLTHFACPKAIAFGVVAALVGTFGDLVESKFKRWVDVKDSATFMPAGMGGFLDMFDSLLFAPALLSFFI